MEILTITETMVIAELAMGEECDKEAMIFEINEHLEISGCEKWKSIEAECYTYKNCTLIIAKPIELLLPKCLFEISR